MAYQASSQDEEFRFCTNSWKLRDIYKGLNKISQSLTKVSVKQFILSMSEHFIQAFQLCPKIPER